MKILAIDDDRCTLAFIKQVLETNTNYTVICALTGDLGIAAAMHELPDLIILDINLPDKNGYDICELIRNKPQLFGNPMILMLTSEIEKTDIVHGFEKGANDYLKKPFEFEELLCRINELGKRGIACSAKYYKYKNITVEYDNFSVFIDDKQVDIKRKECEVLIYLIVNKGLILSREKILKEIWDTEYYTGNRTVDMTISRLKNKLPILESNLETLIGIGYKLI